MSMSFFPRIQATYVESTDCGPCSSDFSWCLQKVLAVSTAEDKLRGSTQWHADNPVKFSPLWSDQKTHQWVISESEAWPNFIKKLTIDQATVEFHHWSSDHCVAGNHGIPGFQRLVDLELRWTSWHYAPLGYLWRMLVVAWDWHLGWAWWMTWIIW